MRAERLNTHLASSAPGAGRAAGPVAMPGRNCWRRVASERAAVLVDGQAYFEALKQAILRARRSILLVGWDLDSRTRLDRENGGDGPNTFGALLEHALQRSPELRVHVLIWNSALIYSWQREFLTDFKLRLLGPRRLQFRHDECHPLGASHHQKIVVIDDAVAFVGGIDVTSGRWDTPAHTAVEPRRHDPVVGSYPPFHDVAMLLSGSAAAALGDLARIRWQAATGRRLRPPPPAEHDPWPPSARPDFRDVEVAIARTTPAWAGETQTREVERLYLDMIAAAERFVYLENQFFASRAVGRALLARLQEQSPPEVAVVTCQEPIALLERAAMGLGRARLYARLRARDHHGRLRLYTPVVPGSDVKVHSKLVIVDDRMLRIGSSNLNNRSMGLDSECDVLIESGGDPAVEAAIRDLRCRLLGEHLGQPPERVATETGRLGLLPGIEVLRGGARSLVPLETTMPDQWTDLLVAADTFDPDRPLEQALAEEPPARGTPMPLAWKVLLLGLLLAGLALAAAAAHQLIPFLPFEPRTVAAIARDLRMEWAGLGLAGGAVVLAGLTPLPMTVPLVLAGGIYGVGQGVVVAMLGTTVSAVLGFLLGRAIGRDLVRRLSGPAMNRVLRAMPRHGILVVTMLRLVPVAPFAVVNMVAGAAPTRFLAYLLGTLAGMLPVSVALVLFGDRAAAVLREPSWFNIGILSALTVALIAIEHALARRLTRAATAVQEGETAA